MERGVYGPRINTPMPGENCFGSVAPVDVVLSMKNGTNTSTAAVPEPMNITSEYDNHTHTSVEDVCELMDINFSRIDTIHSHWRAANERFKQVRSQLRVYKTNNTGHYHDAFHVRSPDTSMLMLCPLCLLLLISQDSVKQNCCLIPVEINFIYRSLSVLY